MVLYVETRYYRAEWPLPATQIASATTSLISRNLLIEGWHSVLYVAGSWRSHGVIDNTWCRCSYTYYIDLIDFESHNKHYTMIGGLMQ